MRADFPAGFVLAGVLTLAAPLLPPQAAAETNRLSDANSDGQITVCIAGDSKVEAIGWRVAPMLRSADNVLQCARFGATAIDLLIDMDRILEGQDGALIPCLALKGHRNQPCDYVVLEIGFNSFQSEAPRPPYDGRCFQNGGPQEGALCRCDWDWAAYTHIFRFCRDGPDFLQWCCAHPSCRNRKVCSPDPRVAGQSGTDPTVACMMGCLHSPQCPDGLCAQQPDMAYHLRRQREILDRIAAHPSLARMVLILPPQVLRGTFREDELNDHLAAIRAFYEDEAIRRGLNVVDARQEFFERCIPLQRCYRDFIHYSTGPDGGVDVISRLIANCLEQTTGAANVRCSHL